MWFFPPFFDVFCKFIEFVYELIALSIKYIMYKYNIFTFNYCKISCFFFKSTCQVLLSEQHAHMCTCHHLYNNHAQILTLTLTQLLLFIVIIIIIILSLFIIIIIVFDLFCISFLFCQSNLHDGELRKSKQINAAVYDQQHCLF